MQGNIGRLVSGRGLRIEPFVVLAISLGTARPALSFSPSVQTGQPGLLGHEQVIPAAFLVAGKFSQGNLVQEGLPATLAQQSWGRKAQNSLGSKTKRKPLFARMGLPSFDNLQEMLRGGSGGLFRRETNDAKYRSRPRVGIEISNSMAIALSALSVLLVSGALPLFWSPPAGPWQSFWLTRIVVLRALSLVYFVAFAVAFNQNTALLGDHGLLPASIYLDNLRKQNPAYPEKGMTWAIFNAHPTWLWLAPKGRMDDCLRGTAALGMLMSAAVFFNGGSNVLLQLAQWLLYHSIVTVGQRWYSFGWESQLLETGFISILMVPLLTTNALPAGFATPWVSLWALRWLCFRIMIGAGMIKIRGDSCWRDLTAMVYHYETQPVPNPFSYFLHWTPLWWHKFETFMNHVIELLMPWFVLLPLRAFVIAGGLTQLLFQATLVLSGNLSFLNWLTMVPPLACLDDGALAFLFSPATVAQVHALNELAHSGSLNAASHSAWTSASVLREAVYAGVCALLVWLSAPVIRNMLSPFQVMNTSFGSWRFVNTYGAFGSITRVREEVIIQGTHAEPDKHWDQQVWREYLFKVKPGEVSRRPPWISPYHYRLDWLLWFLFLSEPRRNAFLPFSEPRRNAWVYHLLGKLLANDPASPVLTLLRSNPFANSPPPKFVRAELYRYEYTVPGSEAANKGDWWRRTRLRTYIPPHTLSDLAYVYQQFAWPEEKPGGTRQEPSPPPSSSPSSSSLSDVDESSAPLSSASGTLTTTPVTSSKEEVMNPTPESGDASGKGSRASV